MARSFIRQAFETFLFLTTRPGEIIWLKHSHNKFFKGIVGEQGLDSLRLTTGTDEDRKIGASVPDPYGYLSRLCQSRDGGLFFIPGKPSEKPLKAYCESSDLLSCEMDDESRDEQWERLQWFSSISGLNWAVIVGSGGKSLHGHLKLDEKIPIELRTRFQRLLALIMRSDPAVISSHQPMRIPGFFRREKGNYQELVASSTERYSTNNIWQGFRACFKALGWEFQQSFCDGRWQRLRAIIVNKKVARGDDEKIDAIADILAMPDEEFEFKPTSGFSGSIKVEGSIPLEEFLSRSNRGDFDRGVSKGGAGRVPTAFKIASNLAAAMNSCQAAGISVSGDGYQILENFCHRCSPSIVNEAARIWKDAQRRANSSHFGIDYVKNRARFYLWKEAGEPRGADYFDWAKSAGIELEEDFTYQRSDSGKQSKGEHLSFNRVVNFFLKKKKKKKSIIPPNLSNDTTSEIDDNRIIYEKGKLPTPVEWAEMGYPPIQVNPGENPDLPDDFDFNLEAIQKGYKHILNAKHAGTGKSHKAGLMGLAEFTLEGSPHKTRFFYNSNTPLNPTTETVEQYFTPLPARSAGYVIDKSRKTPSGKYFKVHVKPGQKPDIQGNCRDVESFFLSFERGRPIHGGTGSPLCETCPEFTGQDGRVKCPLLIEKQEVLKQTHISASLDAMPNPRSTDVGFIDEASTIIKPSKSKHITLKDIELFAGKLSIESDDDKFYKLIHSLLKNAYNNIKNFDSENKKYGAGHIEAIEALMLKRVEFKPLSPAGDEWGWFQPDYTLPVLPPAQDSRTKTQKQRLKNQDVNGNLFKLKRTLARERFESHIWKIYSDDFLNAETAWGTPIWDATFTQCGDDLVEENKLIGWKWAAPSIDDVRKESRRLSTDVQRLVAMKEDGKVQSPEERREIIEEGLLPIWVSQLLEILNGNRKHSVRINGSGLTITSPHTRHEQIVKSYRTAFYMDATATPEDIAIRIRLKPRSNPPEIAALEYEMGLQQAARDLALKVAGNEDLLEKAEKTIEQLKADIYQLKLDAANSHILHVVGEPINYSNLTIKIIHDAGAFGKQRYSKNGKGGLNLDSQYAEGNRAGKLVEAIATSDPTKKTGLIDHACFVDDDSKQVNPVYQSLKADGLLSVVGAHFREGRGSNLFMGCDRIIKLGKAVKNLGELAAQWQAMTGQIVNPTRLTGEFGAWVQRQIVAEDIQEIARLRANRRPGEQLEVNLIASYSQEEIDAIASYFTEAKIEAVEAADLCLEAASRSTQVVHHLKLAIRSLIESGEKLTATKVGEAIGVTQGRVSQLCKEQWNINFRGLRKILVLLLKRLNSKTNENSLDEDELYIAQEFFPNLVSDWGKADVAANVVVEDVIRVAQVYGAEAFEQIIGVSPPDVIAQLVKAILSLVPSEYLNGNLKLIENLQ